MNIFLPDQFIQNYFRDIIYNVWDWIIRSSYNFQDIIVSICGLCTLSCGALNQQNMIRNTWNLVIPINIYYMKIISNEIIRIIFDELLNSRSTHFCHINRMDQHCGTRRSNRSHDHITEHRRHGHLLQLNVIIISHCFILFFIGTQSSQIHRRSLTCYLLSSISFIAV